jgi:hypothetical protein
MGGAMRPFFRTLTFYSAFAFASSFPVLAQDISVRVEAVQLIDHAYAVCSTTKALPDYKQEVTFRVYGPDGITRDGSYNMIVSGTTEWTEVTFGDYHLINLQRPDKTLKSTTVPPPMETLEMLKLVPLTIGRFDHSDTIQSITPATISGRPAKCIHFETINGKTQQSNEVCVDAEQGPVLRWNVGDQLVEDSEYYMFEDVWRPARVRQYRNGKLHMELEQKLSLIDGPIDWESLTPKNAATYVQCQKYERPLIQSAPQPSTAGAGPWYDVKVHGNIGTDGRVHDIEVQAAGRPELEKQAIQIASQWVFSPAMCDGKPTSALANLIVHFPQQ